MGIPSTAEASPSLQSADCETLWTVARQAACRRIPQARTVDWVAMPSSRGSSQPRDRTHLSCIAGGFSTAEPPPT